MVRAADGELVKQYDIPEFPEQLEGLCLDGQENLWYVFQNDQRELMMAQCGTVQRAAKGLESTVGRKLSSKRVLDLGELRSFAVPEF